MTRLLLVLGLVALPVAASAQQAETIEYYGTDAIGSIRIVWDASGNVIARQDFTPFGEPVLQQGIAIPKEGFGGNESDAETNQDYFHARLFEARTGRFTRTDPIEDGVGEPQRWNRYAYGLNNPLSFSDPSGMNANPCDGTDYNTGTCVTAPFINPDWSFGGEWTDLFWAESGGWAGSLSTGQDGRERGGGAIAATTQQTTTTTTTTNPPPGNPPPGNPPCDPRTGSNCGPSVVKAEIDGFLLGATNTCAYLFATEAMSNFVGDNKETSENMAQAVGAVKMRAALSYAASRTNYLGSQGLMYPFKSTVFRKLVTASERALESAVLINADLSIWQALGTEWNAASNGECSASGW